jgi:hypothetical protein
MARRGWVRSILLATLVAAGTAAAQLGLGYGLGIVAWVPPDGDGPTAGGAWTASLAWASWIAATSVVVGAVAGDRSGATVASGRLVRLASRMGVVLAATLGALIVIPLVGVPASRAQILDNYAPHLLAGIYAAIGVLVGLIVALLAVSARAVAANVITSAVWLWTLAIIALADGATGEGPGYGQLAVWKFTDTGPMWRSFYIPGALLMLGAALLIGGLAAFPAAGRGEGRLGLAVSGAAGPLLVTAAYILADPVAGQAPSEQLSAYSVAPFMVLAGLAGSVLVASVGGPPSRRRTRTSRAERRAERRADRHAVPDAPAEQPVGFEDLFPRSPLPPPSSTAVTGKASVPASSRVDPVSQL